jgi:hypothetical protein
LFDLASCCAILFPIVWSIQQLKTEARSEEAAAAASTSEDPDATTSDAPAMKEKLLQLRGFYSQARFVFFLGNAWDFDEHVRLFCFCTAPEYFCI